MLGTCSEIEKFISSNSLTSFFPNLQTSVPPLHIVKIASGLCHQVPIPARVHYYTPDDRCLVELRRDGGGEREHLGQLVELVVLFPPPGSGGVAALLLAELQYPEKGRPNKRFRKLFLDYLKSTVDNQSYIDKCYFNIKLSNRLDHARTVHPAFSYIGGGVGIICFQLRHGMILWHHEVRRAIFSHPTKNKPSPLLRLENAYRFVRCNTYIDRSWLCFLPFLKRS